MDDPVVEILSKLGPTRSSRVAEELVRRGISPEAARKRISRVVEPVYRFPIPLLPKREAFLYLQHQRTTERMWVNFLRDLRETNSAYGAAIDGIAARGGMIPVEEFPIIAGAPLAMRGQVSADNSHASCWTPAFLTTPTRRMWVRAIASSATNSPLSAPSR